MATTNWDQLYTNLPTRAANILREARLKPEKLPLMADGELLSLQGLGDSALAAIRQEYPVATVSDTPTADKTTSKKAKKTDKKAKKTTKKTVSLKKNSRRSHRYQYLKKLTQPGHLYPLDKAIKLQLQLSQSRRLKTAELHLNLTDTGLRGEINLPHSTGQEKTIEIFSDKTITKIKDNNIDFDILIATPKDMPKLARFAKVLGPRGLMPNPKNGNLTDKPKKRAEELSSGSTLTYKSEAKTPIIHLTLGPITQDANKLADNITAIIKHVNPLKIKSAFLTTTHTPSTKIDLSLIK